MFSFILSIVSGFLQWIVFPYILNFYSNWEKEREMKLVKEGEMSKVGNIPA